MSLADDLVNKFQQRCWYEFRRPPRGTAFPARQTRKIPRRNLRLTRLPATLLESRFREKFCHKTACRPCCRRARRSCRPRSEEHTSELQSRRDLVCRLLLEKKKHM